MAAATTHQQQARCGLSMHIARATQYYSFYCTKLAEWICKNMQDELGFPDRTQIRTQISVV